MSPMAVSSLCYQQVTSARAVTIGQKALQTLVTKHLKKMPKCTPCADCPFRSDIEFSLTVEKVQSVIAALQDDGDFPCHQTTAATGKASRYGEVCIGAAIFLEHVRDGGLRANRSFRMREGCFKEFNREELEVNSPVFKDVDAFVTARTRLFSLED